MAGPVSIGPQSEVGLNASNSDIYLEKVTEKVAKWLEDEHISPCASEPDADAISIKSEEMYSLIVKGQTGSSSVNQGTQCLTGNYVLSEDELLSPESLTSRELCAPLHQKKRQLSTDSGVELSHYPGTNSNSGKRNGFVKPCKGSGHVVDIHYPSLSEVMSITSTDSDPANHLTDDKCNALRDNGCSELHSADSGNSSDMRSSSEPELDDVFKSMEQNEDCMEPEMLNKMVAILDACATQHMGNYIRPETLQWCNACVSDRGKTEKSISYYQGRYDESVSTDNGYDDNTCTLGLTMATKQLMSPPSVGWEQCSKGDEVTTGSHETQQDLQFNSDGYVTSPVD